MDERAERLAAVRRRSPTADAAMGSREPGAPAPVSTLTLLAPPLLKDLSRMIPPGAGIGDSEDQSIAPACVEPSAKLMACRYGFVASPLRGRFGVRLAASGSLRGRVISIFWFV